MYVNGPKIVTDGLVLCLDAGNTKSYPGSGTIWTDVSGNNYSGSLTNGPTFGGGNLGSISFDGTNDYVFISNTDGFGIANKAPMATLGIWTNVTQQTGNRAIAGFRDDADFDFYLLITTAQVLEPRVRTATSNYDITTSFTSYYSTWNYLIFTVNTNRSDLYINGSFIGANTNVAGNFGATTNEFRISRNSAGTDSLNYYCDQDVAMVHFYNRALSATEILQNYNATRSRFGV